MTVRLFIIGITGGTGTGKSTALRALDSLGHLTLDGDTIYHELLTDNNSLKLELEARFNGVLQDGEIDRVALGEIVFSDPSALVDLNTITHKYISSEIDRRISAWAAKGGAVAAIDAIALIESGNAKECDVVVFVTAPRDTRISRIMERDGITRIQAEKRIHAQKPDSYYKENCDHVLEDNNGTSAEFEEKCRIFFAGLLSKQQKIHGGNDNA